MNHYKSIFLAIALAAAHVVATAQDNIRTYPLEVTFNKTSSLIFPTIIKNVDRGSKDLLAQKAKGMGNVLQVKAGRIRFPETSLTVITADGVLHQFTVNYVDEPKTLNFQMPAEQGNDNVKPIVFENDMTEDDFNRYAEFILSSRKSMRFQQTGKYKVALALKSIFIKDNTIFFHLRGKNTSNINYTIDFLRFYIRDNKKVNRTASQEVEVKPFFVNATPVEIKGKSINDWVFAVDKFTIPDAKHLVVEMFEHNGGRHLALSISNRTLVKARALP
ncbi:MAG: conjugative transposon protein TraN [Cyclobacteriaceae bacterium]|jgi:conjugative transposon TraN protein|nr:conjugative transposon protein TraN [Cyclobacteriaceae bacterium]